MKKGNVVSINERAFENLRFIRETMERAGSFTAVPGWGGILMGVSALLTALISSRLPSKDLWVASWLGEAVLALAIGHDDSGKLRCIDVALGIAFARLRIEHQAGR